MAATPGWQCPACTLHNDGAVARCGVCGSARAPLEATPGAELRATPRSAPLAVPTVAFPAGERDVEAGAAMQDGFDRADAPLAAGHAPAAAADPLRDGVAGMVPDGPPTLQLPHSVLQFLTEYRGVAPLLLLLLLLFLYEHLLLLVSLLLHNNFLSKLDRSLRRDVASVRNGMGYVDPRQRLSIALGGPLFVLLSQLALHRLQLWSLLLLSPLYSSTPASPSMLTAVATFLTALLVDFQLRILFCSLKAGCHLFITSPQRPCGCFLDAATAVQRRRDRLLLSMVTRFSMLYRSIAPLPLWSQYIGSVIPVGGATIPQLLLDGYLALKIGLLLNDALSLLYFVGQATGATPPAFGQRATAAVAMEAGQADCPICTEEMEGPLQLHCGHLFCEACVSQWLERNHTCPVCRAHVQGGGTMPYGDGRPGRVIFI
eukprot:PLAT289.1.p1 GENE.PLAT289.1~~PLAT289.1.p1  ORF type:complete len:442 (-),score=170.70 PLAT289.1:612-1901(-)